MPLSPKREILPRKLDRVKRLGLSGWGKVAGIVASIATVLALFLSGGGDNSPVTAPSEQDESVKAAGRHILESFHSASFAAMWEEFHPAVKDVIPRDVFLECEEQRGFPAAIKSLKYAGTGAQAADIEGVPSTVSVVSFDVAFADGVKEPEDVRLVVDDSGISYVPAQFEYDFYARGDCPPAEAPDADDAPPSEGNLGASNAGA